MARFLLRGSILRKIMFGCFQCRGLCLLADSCCPGNNTEVAEATAEAAGISEVADTLPAAAPHVNAPHGSAPAGQWSGVRISGPAAALPGQDSTPAVSVFRPNPITLAQFTHARSPFSGFPVFFDGPFSLAERSIPSGAALRSFLGARVRVFAVLRLWRLWPRL